MKSLKTRTLKIRFRSVNNDLPITSMPVLLRLKNMEAVFSNKGFNVKVLDSPDLYYFGHAKELSELSLKEDPDACYVMEVKGSIFKALIGFLTISRDISKWGFKKAE